MCDLPFGSVGRQSSLLLPSFPEALKPIILAHGTTTRSRLRRHMFRAQMASFLNAKQNPSAYAGTTTAQQT